MKTKKVWRYHTDAHSSFYRRKLLSSIWNTRLSLKRREEIVQWVKSLSEEDAAKLQDVIEDIREEEQFENVSFFTE